MEAVGISDLDLGKSIREGSLTRSEFSKTGSTLRQVRVQPGFALLFLARAFDSFWP